MNGARTGPSPIQTMAAILGGALLFVVLAVAIYFSFATLRIATRTPDADCELARVATVRVTARVVEHPDGKYDLAIRQ